MTKDFDNGFEQGSITAANAILAYLNRSGHHDVAAQILAVWDSGSIATDDSAFPVPDNLALTREAAKSQGFTGDACTHCGSMKMQIAGHCQVCTECGASTGCS